MRIAVIAPHWLPVPPPAYGGIETVLDILARGLSGVGHDVLLYTTGDSACPVPTAWTFERAPGVGVGGVAGELRQVIEAYKAVGAADIVHDHTLIGPVYAERFPRLPVVTTNHGPFDGEMSVLYRAVGRRVPVIAISHHQASTARGIPIGGVIHHGVEPDRFPFGGGDGGYVLFIGRMSPDKGVDRAARIARAAGVRLRIAAKMNEPLEYEYFERRVKPLLGGDVEYVGEVGGDAKLDLLAGATCLLNPIAWPEPFGMVMIEALACGTPVVATPCGAAPEIVDDGVTGFLRSREQDLAAVLAHVAGLDRHACRQVVQDRFSVTRLVQDHLRLYQRVLDSGAATGAEAA
jgi:glycosyltransferase involved in cell wall biosynthesis